MRMPPSRVAAAPILAAILVLGGSVAASAPAPGIDAGPPDVGARSVATSFALEKCAGGPSDVALPETAYALDGEIVYTGDLPQRSEEARERFSETPLAKLGSEGVGTLELLCWNQAEALLGVRVRAAVFSIWSAPAPMDGVHEMLESIEADLAHRFESAGEYSADPAAWSASHPEVVLGFDVDADSYVVWAEHPRMNRALFIASSPDVSPPGHERPEDPSERAGVRGFWKHPAPPLRP